MIPLTAVTWSQEAIRELPASAHHRRLVLDYFAARCCGRNVSVGDLHLRWAESGEPIAKEFLPMDAPKGIEAYVQRDLIPVLRTAGARITTRGWAPFRRPVLELAEGAAWLDFVGACRTRSALRH